MTETIRNDSIVLKEYITEPDYRDIIRLEELCHRQDGTNLKLEADYRLHRTKKQLSRIQEINELLYYADGMLVAYLGIASFGGMDVAELNGMTHPEFRRMGLFSKLLRLAAEECGKRDFGKVLLLSDGKSESGLAFIRSVSGVYDFSERRMSLPSIPEAEQTGLVTLRKVSNKDVKEVERLNAMIFGGSGAEDALPEDEERLQGFTYFVERDSSVIGKIKVSYSDAPAFISGFGIVPEERGKGFGKAALREALRLIRLRGITEAELDVETRNDNALSIYKSCGFEERSVMDYYRLPEA